MNTVGDPSLQPQARVRHYPVYTPSERRADLLVHLVGLAGAALGAPVLVYLAARWHGASAITAACVLYIVCLVAMLGFSAAYHTIDRPGARFWLRRGDHAAIFAKIAGTYTPFAVMQSHAWTAAILTVLWSLAAIGMVLKLVQPLGWDRLAAALYLSLGWGAVLLGWPVIAQVSETGFALMLGGGALYTLGVVFYFREGLPYRNAIWHAFVLTATALFFAAILVEIAPRPAQA